MSNEQHGPDQLDYQAFELLGPRTIGPSDYWALGLSDYRAPGLSDPRTNGPPDYRALGLPGVNPDQYVKGVLKRVFITYI